MYADDKKVEKLRIRCDPICMIRPRNGFFLRDFDMQQKNQIPIRNLIFPSKKLEIYFYFKECISIYTFVRGEIVDLGMPGPLNPPSPDSKRRKREEAKDEQYVWLDSIDSDTQLIYERRNLNENHKGFCEG